jgi:hypothetical protein
MKNPINFRDEHVDVRISAKARALCDSLVGVDLRHVSTGVRITPAERRYAEQTHAIRNMTQPHFEAEIEIARAQNKRNGITGPKIDISSGYVSVALARQYAYCKVA